MTETQDWVRVLVPLAVGVAWPVLVGMIVFCFRKPLKDLIGRIRVIKSAVGTAKFAASLDEAKGEPDGEEPQSASPVAPPLAYTDSTPMETHGGSSAAEAARRREASYRAESDAPLPRNPRLQRDWKLSFPNSQSLIDRANDNPVYAILTGYGQLERWFDRALLSHGISQYGPDINHSVTAMARIASVAKLISDESVARVDALSNARNIAAHEPESITKFMALDFLYALDDLFRYLDRDLPTATVEVGPDLYSAP